tara:strand:+ start:347 stop:658 length:312 start_codon:yes stop_codon:yes gene_type:complete
MKLQRWDKDSPPTVRELENVLRREGLGFYRWSDNPGVSYPWHTHPHPEVRWIISGSIKMGLRDGKEIVLNPGDRLDLPANTEHWAKVVSRTPVVYLCASRDET